MSQLRDDLRIPRSWRIPRFRCDVIFHGPNGKYNLAQGNCHDMTKDKLLDLIREGARMVVRRIAEDAAREGKMIGEHHAALRDQHAALSSSNLRSSNLMEADQSSCSLKAEEHDEGTRL